MKLEKHNLQEYIRLVVNKRLGEYEELMRYVREGLDFVIPMEICNLMSWKILEERATGSKKIDLVKLKSITQYEVITTFKLMINFRNAKSLIVSFSISGRLQRASLKRRDQSTSSLFGAVPVSPATLKRDTKSWLFNTGREPCPSRILGTNMFLTYILQLLHPGSAPLPYLRGSQRKNPLLGAVLWRHRRRQP